MKSLVEFYIAIFCLITQEGVGDTQDSYAYDGNRIRKWNVKTLKYGEVNTQIYQISCFALHCLYGPLIEHGKLQLFQRFITFK